MKSLVETFAESVTIRVSRWSALPAYIIYRKIELTNVNKGQRIRRIKIWICLIRPQRRQEKWETVW